ncbi:MAG: helix-turn-helix transcriptional regulator [Clostridia bacterium]|nr:helix-turn-helix transcriptional regulator [Clostridia bacterium]
MYECKIAEKLVELRASKGVTQEDVAQSLSVSNKTISKWENGASTPDLPMVVELAKYYGVTTDTLLGLSEDKTQSVQEEVGSLFKGLDHKESVLKAFEIERLLVPTLFGKVREKDADIYDTQEIFPTDPSCYYRSNITHQNIFKFAASSKDVNLSVMLLRNKANFAWMNDTGKQEEIVKVFRFLSNKDVLSVLYFIHSKNCSTSFTADYVGKNTGIEEDLVAKILDEFWDIGGCGWVMAHLSEGEIKVYECFGDGIILSLISLAYEKMCGRNYNNYSYNGNCHMIGGK